MKHRTTNILWLTNTTRKNIQKEKLFHSLHNLLITFSGGQDSAFCLLILYLLKNKSKEQVPFYAYTTSLKKKKLVWHDKNQITKLVLALSLVTSYTVLWCNHFWQKDAFFTMEHVSKLAFSKKYTIHLFTPVQKVVSEQKARYWRHKIMQRSSFFICQPKFCYELQQSSNMKRRLKPNLIANFVQTKSAFANKKTYFALKLEESQLSTNFGDILSILYLCINKSESENARIVTALRSRKTKTLFLLGFFVKALRAQTKALQKRSGAYKTGVTKSPALTKTSFLFGPGWFLFGPDSFLYAEVFVSGLHRKSLCTAFCKAFVCARIGYCTRTGLITRSALFTQQPERMSRFRTQVTPKLKSGQFINLFLSYVLLAKPLLSTLTEKQSLNLVQHFEPSRISNTTVGLSELLCVQGHNKSDRAEAILFNLMRGAGINGISTLQWKQSLNKDKLCYSYNKTKIYCLNDVFYPIFSDFLKNIPIIYLDIFRYEKQKLIKETNNQNNFSRLVSLQKINLKKRYLYNWIQPNNYNTQNKLVNFKKLNCNYKSKSFIVHKQSVAKAKHLHVLYKIFELCNFKRPLKTNGNKKVGYLKKATLYYKRANLHKTKSTNFIHQNKVNIKMFYYQLKYKQNMFFNY